MKRLNFFVVSLLYFLANQHDIQIISASISTTISEVVENDLAENNSRQLLGLRGGLEDSNVGPARINSQRKASYSMTYSTKDNQKLPTSNITIPLHAHSGSHHVYVYIGSPPQRQALIVDTGSKAMAFPCKTCKKCKTDCCGVHASPYYDITVSTTHQISKCGHCSLDGVSTCSLFGDQCTFTQKYTEGSSWTATEVEDIVWFGTSNVIDSLEQYMSSLAVVYAFGCQTSTKGLFRKQYADGILGLSIHDTSIVKAMYEERLIARNAFTLCFTREGGHLSLGGTSLSKYHQQPMKSTPITREHGYYSVEITSVSIGNTVIIDSQRDNHLLADLNGGKGCIFDSGTTDSFFPSSLRKLVGKNVMEYTNGLTDFSSKYRRHAYTYTEFQTLPIITLEFQNNVTISIRPENYMEDVPIDSKTGQVVRWEGSIPLTNRIYLDESEGTVLGANAMFGNDILFDIQNHQIGIAPANCNFITLTSSQQ